MCFCCNAVWFNEGRGIESTFENTGKFNLHCIHHCFAFTEMDYFFVRSRTETKKKNVLKYNHM